jgi:nicotinamidase-related amidase
MLLDVDQSFLLIVDVQEKLLPAIKNGERVAANIARLIEAATILNVPVLVTEHCPERIGPTVTALREKISDGSVLSKVYFSAVAEPGCRKAFAALNRSQAVVCGTEAHVCVLQTTLGLCEAGYRPALVSDGVGSRKDHDREIAIGRMHDGGAEIVTTEMVIFEWLKRGDTDTFRQLLPVIRDTKE